MAPDRHRVDESSLYPALYRLQEKGLLESVWGRSELDRRAKFYNLNDDGRARLHSESSQWSDFAEAVAGVLHAQMDPRWAVDG